MFEFLDRLPRRVGHASVGADDVAEFEQGPLCEQYIAFRRSFRLCVASQQLRDRVFFCCFDGLLLLRFRRVDARGGVWRCRSASAPGAFAGLPGAGPRFQRIASAAWARESVAPS